jgi:hypothetical protein
MNVEVVESTIQIQIIDENTVVETTATDTIAIEIVDTGPQGPPGEAATGYNFIQSTPQVTWTIAHNLGYKPNLACFNTGGVGIVGSELHLSNNTLTVTFNTPQSGTARLI